MFLTNKTKRKWRVFIFNSDFKSFHTLFLGFRLYCSGFSLQSWSFFTIGSHWFCNCVAYKDFLMSNLQTQMLNNFFDLSRKRAFNSNFANKLGTEKSTNNKVIINQLWEHTSVFTKFNTNTKNISNYGLWFGATKVTRQRRYFGVSNRHRLGKDVFSQIML